MGDELEDDYYVHEAIHATRPPASAKRSARRPAADADEADETHGSGMASQSSGVTSQSGDGSAAARRKRRKANGAQTKRRAPDVAEAVDADGEAQARYVSYWYNATAKNWRTDAELADRTFADTMFIDTTAATTSSPHTDDQWVPFLKHVCPEWKTALAATNSHGTPHLLILAASGQRAADIVRCLVPFQKLCKVAKLFAKHIKIEEQVQHLQTHPVRIAVGTPNRVSKLIECGALNLDDLALVIIDCHKDIKQRSPFDVPEVCVDIMHFIEDHCWVQLKTAQAHVALF